MIDPGRFYEGARSAGVGCFVGVPDSLLKDFCAYVSDHGNGSDDLVSANEGAAVAYAAGRYLASSQIGMVYMQNSGLGNIVNPITSLADDAVYGIPMVLLIGWRGEPGNPDEPQHVKQGEINNALLEVLGVPYQILPTDDEGAILAVEQACRLAVSESRPQALVVRKGSFSNYSLRNKPAAVFELKREEALECILKEMHEDDVIVSTTGKTSREIFELRETFGQGHERDFLTVGSMGHASSIAHGIAEGCGRRVLVIDGDGAALMHLGSLAIIGSRGNKNFRHLLINNGAHESVGGQPTVGLSVDFVALALACGYKEARSVDSRVDLASSIAWLNSTEGPVFLEVKVSIGSRPDLGRPTISPALNKEAFMENLAR